PASASHQDDHRVAASPLAVAHRRRPRPLPRRGPRRPGRPGRPGTGARDCPARGVGLVTDLHWLLLGVNIGLWLALLLPVVMRPRRDPGTTDLDPPEWVPRTGPRDEW